MQHAEQDFQSLVSLRPWEEKEKESKRFSFASESGKEEPGARGIAEFFPAGLVDETARY